MRLYARLFPYNPNAGYLVKSFTFKGVLYRGGVRPSWYECTKETKKDLEKKTQRPGNPYAKPLFQFCDENGLKAIETDELNQIIAAKVLAEGALVDRATVPQSRIIPLPEEIKGGRAAAIPPVRDTGADEVSVGVVATAVPVEAEPVSDIVTAVEIENEPPPPPPKARRRRKKSSAKKDTAMVSPKTYSAPSFSSELSPPPLPLPSLPLATSSEEGGPISTKDLPTKSPKK